MQYNWDTYATPDVLEDVEMDVDATLERELVVFNDDVNTFDHVIDTLMQVCQHTAEQAEQCTLLIHFKGKCTVKVGTFNTLKPMRDAICDRGISAEVL
ncbi:MAG: ATP-dependent Clp protease adaptor ClpS [Thermoflexibacteraceae bacterium]|jgi:ATP-dependent Clp protease adaptor protein ClpS